MIAIPEYEGLYSVTEDGGIYSHRTGKLKKPVRHKKAECSGHKGGLISRRTK